MPIEDNTRWLLAAALVTPALAALPARAQTGQGDEVRTYDTVLVTAQRREESLRSEEHTSELQSRRNLVCRLLLEKKNTPTVRSIYPGQSPIYHHRDTVPERMR